MKKVVSQIKLQIPAGKANPAPPVGSALGPDRHQHHGLLQGVQRQDGQGRGPDHPGGRHRVRRPFVHLHHQDPARGHPHQGRRRRSPRAAATPNKNKVGKITMKQVEEIAKLKLPDLNSDRPPGVDAPGRWAPPASMGVEVVGLTSLATSVRVRRRQPPGVADGIPMTPSQARRSSRRTRWERRPGTLVPRKGVQVRRYVESR